MDVKSAGVRDSHHDYPDSSFLDLFGGNAAKEAAGALSKLQADATDTLRSAGKVGTGIAERLERSLHSASAPKPEKQEKVQWLFAVDVTTKNFGAGDDIEMRLSQLKEMAWKTKGKPEMAVVAQVAIADTDDKNIGALARVVGNPYHLDRYLIRDGKMTKIDSVNSDGYAGDVKNLLTFATERFKADKMGLLIDSHGSGNKGLDGDTGHSSVEDFANAIKTGLKGREKLDLVDFDCCLMGQNGVLNKLRPLADHIVASAETEGGLGQDLTSPIEHVINYPHLTADQLGEIMVETARIQRTSPAPARERPDSYEDLEQWMRWKPKGDGTPHVPIETLAHYNLNHYDRFQNQLNGFGLALAGACKDKDNRETIDKLVSSTPTYGGYSVKRDLKGFTDGVMNAIADGSLKDPTDQIRVTAGRLLDAQKRLVESYSGFNEYAARGGLTTWIPERKDVDYVPKARRWITACEFSADVDKAPADLTTGKDEFGDKLHRRLTTASEEIAAATDAKPEVITEVKAAWKVADEAVEKLKKATKPEETTAALAEIKAAAGKLEGTAFYKKLLDDAKAAAKLSIDEKFNAELVTNDDGWGKFRYALRKVE